MSETKVPEQQTVLTPENEVEKPANESVNADNSQDNTSEKQIQQLQIEIEDWKQKYLYLSAEFENYKKRTLKERIEFSKMANAEIMSALLPVLDDFERSVKAFEKVQNNAALEGVVLIQHKLKSVLEHKGLKSLNSMGAEFDVELHEAITNLPVNDESQKGKVVEELERGYLLNDKILRHAKVAVGA